MAQLILDPKIFHDHSQGLQVARNLDRCESMAKASPVNLS